MTGHEPRPAGTARVETTRFHGAGFTMSVPTGWITAANHEWRAMFVGPIIGPAPVTVGVTTAATIPPAAAWLEALGDEHRRTRSRFTVVRLEQLEASEFEAWSRIAHWYDEARDITFFERAVIIDVASRRWIIVAVQPNGTGRRQIDAVFREMIESFRITTRPPNASRLHRRLNVQAKPADETKHTVREPLVPEE